MLTFGAGLIKTRQQEPQQIPFNILWTLTVEPIEFSFQRLFQPSFPLFHSVLSLFLFLFSSSLWNALIYGALVQTTHLVIKLQAPRQKNLLQLIIHIICHCVLKCSQVIKLVFSFALLFILLPPSATSSDLLFLKKSMPFDGPSFNTEWLNGKKKQAAVITRSQANPL